MARAIVTVLAALFVVTSAVVVVYTLGIRSKNASVRNAARRFHHLIGNPLQMRSAGTPGAPASVLRHRGRTTGETYDTPVWAAPTEDGFVIGIVYGGRTDWVKNVLTTGAATIVHDGEAYRVTRPEVVPMDGVRAYFPAWTRRLQRPVHVDRCLRVRRIDAPEASAADVLRRGHDRSSKGAWRR